MFAIPGLPRKFVISRGGRTGKDGRPQAACAPAARNIVHELFDYEVKAVDVPRDLKDLQRVTPSGLL